MLGYLFQSLAVTCCKTTNSFTRMKWRCSCVSCSCCMHSEDSRQTMETFAPVTGHLEMFTLRIREEMNAAYEAPCFCLYIASLKLLFICLNLFICLFITCLILKKIILKLVRLISILRVNKPITIGFTSPCTMTHYFLWNSLEAIDLSLASLVLILLHFATIFQKNHLHHLRSQSI